MIILLEPEHTIQIGDEFYHPYLCAWEPVLDEWIGSNPLPEPFGLPIRRKMPVVKQLVWKRNKSHLSCG